MKLGMVLASISVGVGAAAAIIAVQTYYTQETIRDKKRLKEAFSANHFIVDRIIDGDCFRESVICGCAQTTE